MASFPANVLPVCPMEKPRRKRVLDDKACEVCNDKSTGKHYGVYVCDGCSGFFKRSVRRALPWVCRGDGHCVVDKASRTECRACRYKKCLMVNMNPEGVQTARGSRVTHDDKNSDSDSDNSFSVNMSSNSEMTGAADYSERGRSADQEQSARRTDYDVNNVTSLSASKTSSAVPYNSPPLSMAHTGGDVESKTRSPVMVKVEDNEQHDAFGGGDDKANDIGHVSENDANYDGRPSGFNPAVAGQPNNTFASGQRKNQRAQIVPFSSRQPEFYEQARGTPVHSTILAETHFSPYPSATPRFPSPSSIPQYSTTDQHVRSPSVALPNPSGESRYGMAVRLLSNAVKFVKNMSSFKLLPFRDQVILVEENWKDLFILGAAHWSFPMEISYVMSPLDAKKEANAGLVTSMRDLQELVSRIQALEIDETECEYLKTIVVFKPDVKGLKDSQQVEKVQDETQVKLSEYVRQKNPDNPARFGRLLLTLPGFERISPDALEKLFFRSQDENISVEYILHDMFKST